MFEGDEEFLCGLCGMYGSVDVRVGNVSELYGRIVCLVKIKGKERVLSFAEKRRPGQG